MRTGIPLPISTTTPGEIKLARETWTFTYDANGMRTSRSSSSATYSYVYNGSQLSQMTVDGNTLYFAYDASGTPLSVTYNGTTYYYATNLQCDITAILNTSGTAVVTYTYDAWGHSLSTSGSMASTLGIHNPLRYRGYVYDTETGLYYLQSRYYNPQVGRFLNADAFAATGQGLLGNNMFIYCLNNPVIYCDPAGTQAQIWPTLFGNHDPGYIHRSVQAHIIATGLFESELYLPGTGRADIYDPKTFEIWEIKHGGSTTETQISRTESARNQVGRYVSSNKIYRKGHAGAFTGAFVINSNNVSYLVTYHTPDDGVILYYVQEMPHYEPLASFSYDISVVSVEKNTHTAVVGGALVGGVFLGGGSFDPLLQTCNTN